MSKSKAKAENAYVNYTIDSLKSENDTDDDEEPRKPIPAWANLADVTRKVKNQSVKMLNFTSLFKMACQSEINLNEIFLNERKTFTQRSSSAIWNSPPVWRTGLNGEESFRNLNK